MEMISDQGQRYLFWLGSPRLMIEQNVTLTIGQKVKIGGYRPGGTNESKLVAVLLQLTGTGEVLRFPASSGPESRGEERIR